ncbi:zinc finger protein 451 [Elysia marginata]|uniref:Zinc finger protein 451 n=1 Tax=Elysia marginata TaxID=1093978 RepID=A0AAV4EHC3_9GAST|nr:zinc finger protein 451 [Elysia marginata]
MKTQGESGRGKRPMKSSLKTAFSNKSSKCQKLRKKVRFDLPKRLTPSDAAPFKECIGQCRRTGFNQLLCCNEMQLKSRSCDNVMCPESADKTKPWQSVTCLAPPPSPTKCYSYCSSACWMKLPCGKPPLGYSTGPIMLGKCHRLQPKKGIMRKKMTRVLSCKDRIPTPRWVRYPTGLKSEQAPNPRSSCCLNCANVAHSSKDFCVVSPKLRVENGAFSERYNSNWSLSDSAVKEVFRASDLSNQRDQRRWVIEDLSQNIGRLQIASRKAKCYPCIGDLSEESNSTWQSTSNELLGFVEMNPCLCDSTDQLGKHDDCNNTGRNVSGNSYCDTNNSSVEKKPKQEVTSQIQNSSKDHVILSSTVNMETTETDVNTSSCSSHTNRPPDCADIAHGHKGSDPSKPANFVHSCTSQALTRPSSSNKPTSNDYLLDKSTSVDSVVAVNCSATTTLHPYFDLLVNPENEIDEEFWHTVCPDNSTDDFTSPASCSSFAPHTATDLTGEMGENTDAQCSNKPGQGSSDRCHTTSPETQHVSDKNHSSLTKRQTVLGIHNSSAALDPYKGDVQQTHSVSQTSLDIPPGSESASEIGTVHHCPARESVQADTDVTVSVNSNQHSSEVIEAISEPANNLTTDNAVSKDSQPAQPNNTCAYSNNSKPYVTQDEDFTKTENTDNQGVAGVKKEVEEIREDEQPQPLLMCCVLNCNLQFSTPSLLNEHVAQMNHSPCNPLATILDGIEPSGCIRYMCPRCGEIFEDEDSCQAHMFQARHACLLSPVPTTVYACPECLRFFSDFSSAQQHMDNMSHHGYAFYFPDDLPNRAQPIPVPQRLMREIVSRCKRVKYSLVCQDCGLGLADTEELRFHLDSRHIVAAKCCTSVRDVFADLLTDQACAECGQFIYQGLPPTGMCLHIDCPFQGPVLSWPARTLREFVLRCGISGTGVATELNLDCNRRAPHPTSPLVLAVPDLNSGNVTTETMSSEGLSAHRSLSESTLRSGDDIDISKLIPVEAGPSSEHLAVRDKTKEFNVVTPTVSREVDVNVGSSSWRSTESDSTFDPTISQCVRRICDPQLTCESTSEQMSTPSTSAACTSSMASSAPCSSKDVQSVSNFNHRGFSYGSCPCPSNSRASCRSFSSTSLDSSNMRSLMQSCSFVMEIDSDGDDDDNNVNKENVCLGIKPPKESSDNGNTGLNDKKSTNPTAVGKPNDSTSQETFRHVSPGEAVEKPSSAFHGTQLDVSKTSYSESNPSETLFSVSPVEKSADKSNRMVFGSGASLDKGFLYWHPRNSSDTRNSRDQSTQVEMSDGLGSSANYPVRQNAMSLAQHVIVSRLTATLIPQTDTIFISSLAEKPSTDDDEIGNRDIENEDDVGIRYFVTNKQTQHFQSKLHGRRLTRLPRYLSRQRRVLHSKVVARKRKVQVRKLKRRSGTVKASLKYRGKLSKSFRVHTLSVLSKSPNDLTCTASSLKHATYTNPLLGLLEVTISASKAKELAEKDHTSSSKSEPTYKLVKADNGPVAKHNDMEIECEENPETSQVPSESREGILSSKNQELRRHIESDLREDKSNLPSVQNSKNYPVKKEITPCDLKTQFSLRNDNEIQPKDSTVDVSKLSADESRYFILTEDVNLKNAGPEKQSNYSHLYKTGPSKASPICSDMFAQGALQQESVLPLVRTFEQDQKTTVLENRFETEESLGVRLALETKTVENDAEESVIGENFHSQDKFMAVKNATLIDDSVGESYFCFDSSINSIKSVDVVNPQYVEDNHSSQLSKSRYPNNLEQLLQAEHEPSCSITYSYKDTELQNTASNLKGIHTESHQQILDKMRRKPQRKSAKNLAANKALTKEDNGDTYKALNGPQTRSCALYKRRGLAAANKGLKKNVIRKKISKAKSTTQKKSRVCKKGTRRILRNQTSRSCKFRMSKRAKGLKKKCFEKNCSKLRSNPPMKPRDRFIPLRTTQLKCNTCSIPGTEAVQHQQCEDRSKKIHHRNVLCGKLKPKCTHLSLSSTQPNTQLGDTVSTRPGNSYENAIKQSNNESKQTTTRIQCRRKQRSDKEVNDDKTEEPKTKSEAKFSAQIYSDNASKQLPFSTNNVERDEEKELPMGLPQALDVVSQVAPRLVHSLMLSLDGPSSSRSSLLSRPSSTTAAAACASSSVNSQAQASSMTAVQGHSHYHKLRTPKIQHLSSMCSIVFADLENFMFFKHFRGSLPPLTFVWGFISARPQGPFHREKYFRKYQLYRELKSNKCTHVSTDIGYGKDAVDFAMTLAIAKLDDRLPASIRFYIVSNDGGFREVENQMRRAKREVKVIAPRRHSLTIAGFA